MAEFRVVMEQARRLCKAHELCGTCILYDYCDQFNDTRGGQWDVDAAAFERTVMDWAEEHPEPQYPTWVKWLSEQGIIACGNPIVWRSEALQPIPTDIAERLGIEPIKEGEG